MQKLCFQYIKLQIKYSLYNYHVTHTMIIYTNFPTKLTESPRNSKVDKQKKKNFFFPTNYIMTGQKWNSKRST